MDLDFLASSTWDQYQQTALSHRKQSLAPVYGLVYESGEFAEKLVHDADVHELMKELSDVLYYTSLMMSEMGKPLSAAVGAGDPQALLNCLDGERPDIEPLAHELLSSALLLCGHAGRASGYIGQLDLHTHVDDPVVECLAGVLDSLARLAGLFGYSVIDLAKMSLAPA